ncbi:MAG: hypothetical protein H0X01_07105 [Nitrospira sp.]|nr:hypothetical protein [Nitrospira sp.]
MNNYLRARCVVAGCFGFILLSGTAGAQPGTSHQKQTKEHSGGTQGTQEQLYEDRMKDSQESQSPQGMKKQSDMGGGAATEGHHAEGGTSGSSSKGTMKGAAGDTGSEKGQAPSKSPGKQ